jgi:hypothetical protein
VLALTLSDHREHLAQAQAFARGSPLSSDERAESPPTMARLEPELRRCGVVRGSVAGDPLPAAGPLAAGAAVPDYVPGVVRALVLRRDGTVFFGEADPHLQEIGLRLAGGRELVREVRR